MSIDKTREPKEAQAVARVGIDFGGVIVRNRKQIPREDTNLADSDQAEVAHDGVFEAIRGIVSFCDGHVWIISKAGPHMQKKTRAWFDAVDFFSRTDLDPDHVRFCLERQEKEILCRELKISHFVDDRAHVMQILRHTVPHLYLFGEHGGKGLCPPWATFVSEWTEVLELLMSSVPKYHSTRE